MIHNWIYLFTKTSINPYHKRATLSFYQSIWDVT